MTAPAPLAGLRILVVDDNRAIHEDFRKIFETGRGPTALSSSELALFGEAEGASVTPALQVDSAYQGEEALGMVRQALEQQRPYALAFMDVRMPPGWDGIETTAQIWKHDPDIQIVICTAYSDYSWGEMLAKLGRSDRLVILKKPFDTIEVLQLASALTEKWRLGRQSRSILEDLERRVAERTRDLILAEERQRALIENISDIIVVTAPDGTVRFVSEAILRVSGFAPADVAGQRFSEFLHPDDLKRVAARLVELVREPAKAMSGEYRLRHAQGGWRDVELVSRNLIADPAIGGIVTVMRDITQRRAADADLRMANLLIEQSPSVLFRWAASPGWPVLYVSQNVRRWGYEPEELVSGKLLFTQLMHPEDLVRIKQEVKAAEDSGAAHITLEYRAIKRSGEVIWLDERSVIERDATGQPVFFQGVVTDITERKVAEGATRENEQLLRAITDAAMDGVILMDDAGKLAFWNQAAERILGYSQADVMGQPLHALLAPLRYRDEFLKRFAEFSVSGEGPIVGRTVELQALRKDGAEVPIELAVSAVQIKGRWTAVGIMRDITERKRAEQNKKDEFQRAQVQLEAISQVVESPALSEGDLETLARQVTEVAARATGAERANAWLFNKDETELHCVDLYEATPARHSSGMVLKESEFQNEFRALKTARYVNADDPLTDPRTAGYVESYLKPLHISSMLDVVIEASGKHLGLLCIEHVNKPHHWDPDEIAFANQLADKLGLGLANRGRRQMTIELQEAQRVAHLGNWRLDAVTGEVTWSEEIFRIFGLDPAGSAPRLIRHAELMTAESLARMDAAITKCQQSGQAYELELELTAHPSGERRWINARGEAQRDTTGVVVAVRGTAQDITTRKNAELGLKLFRELIDRSSDAIEVIEPATMRFLDVNQRACLSLGYSREELLQMTVFDIDPQIRKEHLQTLEARLGNGEAVVLDTVHRRKDGVVFPVEVSIKRVQLDRAYQIVSVRDVTERKLQEAHLAGVTRALQVLRHANSAVLHATDEASLYQDMTRAIVEQSGYSMAWVGLAQEDATQTIKPAGTAGDTTNYIAAAQVAWSDLEHGQGPAGRCVRSGKPAVSQDIASDPSMVPWRDAALAAGFKSVASLPLNKGERTFGVLNIYAGDRDAFNQDELHLLGEMADNLAHGVEALRATAERQVATQQLRRSLEGTIGAISSTMELRDPYTAGHERRVAVLAKAIATEMRLPEAVVEGIQFGSLIHDLGKIYVPAEILSKPTRLSKLEYEMIKTHPQAGYDIIKNVEFPWPVALMVLQHHERLDGSGYPQGLKGADIILESRILAVADVVEAMSSHRPYRAGLGIEAALKEIEGHKDIWFDAAAVDACLKLFREKHFSLNDG